MKLKQKRKFAEYAGLRYLPYFSANPTTEAVPAVYY
jgi:hypothetical protein